MIQYPPSHHAFRSTATLLAATLLIALGLQTGPANSSEPAPAFVSSWGTALLSGNPKGIAWELVNNATVRQTMRVSLGGDRLRVRISNVHGSEPLVLGAAWVGDIARPGSSELTSRASAAIHFDGASHVTIAAGSERVSDPLAWPVQGGSDIAVSLHIASAPVRQSVHLAAHATQFIAPGDQSAHQRLEGDRPFESWMYVTGIEVARQPAPVLVAIGDSLTDGSGSGKDANERWTDYLVRRMLRNGSPATGVVNAGIGGNRMLRDGNGPRLLDRFERDVLSRPGVTHTVILIGVNDLGHMRRAGKETAESRRAMLAELQLGWRDLLARAHARGVCVIAGTMTPYGGSHLFKPEAHNEDDRQAINRWLRSEAGADAIADFDAAVSDPNKPSRLASQFDSGDHLHLSPAGYSAMADAIPLDRLGDCKRKAL